MEKVWNDRRIFTEEQIVIMQPNESFDSIVLVIEEIDKKQSARLYLTYGEAKCLAENLLDFVNIQNLT